MKAAIYARVSTVEQTVDNQLLEVRRYVDARWAAEGTQAVEYVDIGESGSKDRRPALDRMLADAKRRKFDVLVCWRLDRLGRNLKHLVSLIDDLQAVGVTFVSLGEGIDLSTPSGKLQLHILAALAEFERGRLRERTLVGLQRARAQGKTLGRPVDGALRARLAAVPQLGVRAAARMLGCSTNTVLRYRRSHANTKHSSSAAHTSASHTASGA